jgi:2-methylaconitate cis-trans-isomerase PrpF
MRGGTSKGPFFLATDLPADIEERDAVLLDIMGSGHPLQVDGIGGGSPTTSKVAIISRSDSPDADVDYLFAQVRVKERIVDTSPNCGNMLAAVGPYAIEAGLIAATPDETLVRIFNVNTRKIIEARIQTPDGRITYDGDTHIDGVPGHAAPIFLSFIDAAGAVTGKLLPTGAATDIVDGIEVTCVDCAIPMVLFRATDFGLTGHEAAQTLTENTRLTEQLDALRIECGNRMGISSPEKMVIPKPVLIAPAQRDGTLAVRYFMPHDCHPALATTGAVGIAIATVTPGTIAATISGISSTTTRIKLEHPSGAIEVGLDWRKGPDQPVAGVIRTARRLFEGSVLTKRELPLKKSA